MSVTRLSTTCHGRPNQIEGELGDGRPFYFRGRHGHWELCIGQPGETVDGMDIDDPAVEGDDDLAGWWDVDYAEQFCRDRLAEVAS